MKYFVHALVATLTLAAACGPDSGGTKSPANDGSTVVADAGSNARSDAAITPPTHDAGVVHDAGMSVVTNPLIATMPGMWAMVMANDRPINDHPDYMVTVNPADPGCVYNGHPQGDPGDACVHGLSPLGKLILTDDRLQYRAFDNSWHAEGQVLDDGRRIALTSDSQGEVIRYVYTKR